MATQPITISVIIPIYNDELYLNDALLSIQQQTFGDFECICVNDGSVDKSEEIIDQFVSSDSRFIKLNRQNGGVSAARNSGLNAAKGEYVFMMDHDDMIPAHTLQNLFEAIQKHNADMARGRMTMISEDLKIEQLPKGDLENKTAKFYQDPLTDFYKYIRRKNKHWFYVWMCLFRKSVINDVRFLEELRSGGEDNLFMFEAISKLKNFVQISDIVACHRYSKTSVTLNGYKPALFFHISTVVIPYIYQKYALDKTIDKRLLWWVYRKESYAIYRYLIRNTIRYYDINHLQEAQAILFNLDGNPAFDEIVKRWNLRQKLFYYFFLKGKFENLKKFKIFM